MILVYYLYGKPICWKAKITIHIVWKYKNTKRQVMDGIISSGRAIGGRCSVDRSKLAFRLNFLFPSLLYSASAKNIPILTLFNDTNFRASFMKLKNTLSYFRRLNWYNQSSKEESILQFTFDALKLELLIMAGTIQFKSHYPLAPY